MFKIVLLTSLFFTSSIIYAGNGSSGGGGAFVCRNKDNQIKSSHLLDLWESQYILNLNVPLSNDRVEDQIATALNKLSLAHPLLAKETAKYITIIFSKAHILDDEIALPAPEDADPHYQKKDCPLEGMMFFNGKLDQLEISPSVFNKLATNTDIAASKIHEAIYYVVRNNIIPNSNIYGGKVSTPIRRLVGCLFSTDNECVFSSMSKDQIIESTESAFLCTNSNISYYLLKNNTELEAFRAQYDTEGCNFVISGGYDKSWVGMLNSIKDQNFLIPTLFLKDKKMSFVHACSHLIKYDFSTIMNADTQVKKDPTEGYPKYTNFLSGDLREKFGTPTCQKIK